MPNDDAMLDWIPQSVPWKNWHETVKAPIIGTHMVWYPADEPQYGSSAINRCTAQIQRAIADARAKGRSCRVVGRGWSLSDIAVTNGALIDLSRLKGMKPLAAQQLDPAYPGTPDDAAGLWLIQCGAYISEINRMIESDRFGRSMRTTGAANGQTIVGAAATGTHGSVLGRNALHDQIVAVHLLAGDKKQYWLERASYPVLKPSLAASLGAEVKRDDKLFNAVVLGLGAFGVIHNVVLETRPRALFKAISFDKDAAGKPLVLDEAMRKVIATLDFASHPMLKPAAGLGKPYFFQPIIDPNSNPVQVLATMMFEQPWQQGYQPDYRMAEAKFGPGYDFLSTLGRLLDVFKPGVPLVAQVAKAELFDTRPRTASWGELFGFKTPRTLVASGSVAVPLERALETLDILIALNKTVGPAPLVFGCRYVAKSKALLAMNRFDTTFVVSIDGVYNKTSLAFFAAVPKAMEAAGIPFGQHWGKANDYTPARVRAAFGSNLDDWIAARHELLPDPADRAMFTNDYMRKRGLDA
ncbi:MAG: FAD-binding protein [Sphingomonas bacterium]|uniref:FAD-binding protein n=1 Tax=Sphingomonas bacterium TaxID=1895847 RepID=UPI002635F913|nr:FAD-binding protein [Sphingomonas bacterium]MDB5704726.1 FAD-binding protein [Sphingomonas bacterium]